MNFLELFNIEEVDVVSKQKSINILQQTGVYFLLKNNKIVYVGQTKRGFFNRISFHLKSNKEFDNFTFLPIIEDELDFWENMYIVKFHPKYNKSLNPNIAYLTIKECSKRLYKEYNLKTYNKCILEAIKYLKIPMIKCVDGKERFFEYYISSISNYIEERKDKNGNI